MSEGAENKQMSYEETLAYSQGVRKQIVEQFTKDKITTDTAELGIVLKALKDMDVTAIENKRANTEEKNSDSSRRVAEAMYEFIKIAQNENPFKVKEGSSVGRIPEIDITQLGEHEIPAGMLDVEVQIEEANDFIARMDTKRREELLKESEDDSDME